MVVAPRMSGSTAGTLAAAAAAALPRMRSMIHAPRSTGEVVVPFAVTFSTLACVMQSAARAVRRQRATRRKLRTPLHARGRP